MCIAIAKPRGRTIPISTLERCWTLNSDGAGFAWVSQGERRVSMIKGLMSWSEFKSAYRASKLWRDVPMMLHFRIATHGAVLPQNTHPFWIREGELAMAHNGCLRGYGSATESDTAELARALSTLLETRPVADIANPGLVSLLHEATRGSKLVFLDGAGKLSIIHEDVGIVDNGVWYSNSGFRAAAKKGRSGWSFTEIDWDEYSDGAPLYEPCKACGGLYYYRVLNRFGICHDCSELLKEADDKEAGKAEASSVVRYQRRCQTCDEWVDEDEMVTLCPDCYDDELRAAARTGAMHSSISPKKESTNMK